MRSPKAPARLRASKFSLSGEEFVVFSFPSTEAALVDGLTRAEREVLRAAIDGLSNVEIAAARRRSLTTIQNQLAAAYRKLGVSSRAEAAALLCDAHRERA